MRHANVLRRWSAGARFLLFAVRFRETPPGWQGGTTYKVVKRGMSDNKIIYDYLTISSKVHTTQDMITLLGVEGITFEDGQGTGWYRKRLYFDGISIRYDPVKEDMEGVCLEMSGEGCRAFESYSDGNFDRLFSEVAMYPGDMNITRLDVAYDDHLGVLDLDTIRKYTEAGSYISKFTKANINIDLDKWQTGNGRRGYSVNFGSMKSELYLRIYDKAFERKKDGHWIRVELQLRNERAKNFVSMNESIGEKYAGVLMQYLRFVDHNDSDINRWRSPTTDWWRDFLNNASGISIYEKPGVEYNYLNLENYVIKQAGNAIDTYIEIRGIDGLLEDLKKRGTIPNPKYKILKEQCCHGTK